MQHCTLFTALTQAEKVDETLIIEVLHFVELKLTFASFLVYFATLHEAKESMTRREFLESYFFDFTSLTAVAIVIIERMHSLVRFASFLNIY